MNLRAGFLFCVAPRFHSRLAWPERLRINGGIQCAAGRFYPRGDWRQPNAEELALLLGSPGTTACTSGAPDAILPPTQAALFTIPPHVRAAWWAVADGLRPASFRRGRSPLGRYAVPSQASDSDAACSQSPPRSLSDLAAPSDQQERPIEKTLAAGPTMEGYGDFVAGLIEFLRFKRLPLPEHCQFEVVATRPGQLSTRLDPTAGALAGLDFRCARAAEVHPARRLVAMINLGDEASHVVLLNLPPPAMAVMLAVEGRTATAHPSAAALCAAFFASLPEYPLVQVRLDPGDGLWLPDGPVVCDGYTQEKREIDIVMNIQTAG